LVRKNIIGLSIGFDDALYFSRVFSKVINTNPRAYRKSAKHGE
jgi:AraC-like DNA-binding protein